MRFIAFCLFLATPALVLAAPADGSAARTKRLIDADLKRALREQAEGDSDECIEALDHATKLLAGAL